MKCFKKTNIRNFNEKLCFQKNVIIVICQNFNSNSFLIFSTKINVDNIKNSIWFYHTLINKPYNTFSYYSVLFSQILDKFQVQILFIFCPIFFIFQKRSFLFVKLILLFFVRFTILLFNLFLTYYKRSNFTCFS